MWQRLVKREQALPSQTVLAEKYANFQRLLSANNAILALMTDMEEKLSGDFIFDLQYIRASVSQLAEETASLVEALNNLGDHRYERLIESHRRIIGEVQEALNQRRGCFNILNVFIAEILLRFINNLIR